MLLLVASVELATKSHVVDDPRRRRALMTISMVLLFLGQLGLLGVTLFLSLEVLSVWNLIMISIAIRSVIRVRRLHIPPQPPATLP